MNKLKLFKTHCEKKDILRLGWKPINSNFTKQLENTESELQYELSDQTILGFFVGAHYQAGTVYKLPKEDVPNDLLHLVGYFKDQNTVYFGESTEDWVDGFAP